MGSLLSMAVKLWAHSLHHLGTVCRWHLGGEGLSDCLVRIVVTIVCWLLLVLDVHSHDVRGSVWVLV